MLRLLRAGADTALRTMSGQSALQTAKEQGHAECVEAFRQHVKESVVAGRPAATAAGSEGAGGSRRRFPRRRFLGWIESHGDAISSGGGGAGVERCRGSPNEVRQHIAEVAASRREALAGGAGGDPSVEAAAGARAAASSGSLFSLPTEVAGAAVRGDEAALLTWLDSGGRVDATCGDNCFTAPMLAAGAGVERVVDMLLRRGAEADLQDSDGLTALMVAASQGFERVVDLLMQHGAEINMQESDGDTALILRRPQRPRAGGRLADSARGGDQPAGQRRRHRADERRRQRPRACGRLADTARR